jgi:hypothetical protein
MDNVGFIGSAYVATLLVVGGYTWTLWQRLRRARAARTTDDPTR